MGNNVTVRKSYEEKCTHTAVSNEHHHSDRKSAAWRCRPVDEVLTIDKIS